LIYFFTTSDLSNSSIYTINVLESAMRSMILCAKLERPYITNSIQSVKQTMT